MHLPSRGVVRVSGPDAATLLNGLLTNDVAQLAAAKPQGALLAEGDPLPAMFAAMLTPQGKYMFDMFVVAHDDTTYYLDVSRPADFTKRLSMYRLRSKVVIEDLSDSLGVYADLSSFIVPPDAMVFADPRLAALGSRMIAPHGLEAPDQSYLAHRLGLGVPDPDVDLLVEKDFVMEGLFDELHGLDHHKGCYVGQEMTSRMKRRTSVKNKLCRIRFNGAPPTFDTPIMADGWEVGRMRSAIEGIGLALIRFDRVRKASAEGHALMANTTPISLDPPDWLVEPE